MAPDGSATLRCPDGSEVRLPPVKPPESSGSLRGEVTRFGLTNHAGIEVCVADAEGLCTLTDERGRYAIDGVPPGKRAVTARLRGYVPERLEDLLVLPGVRELEPRVLVPGRQLLAGPALSMQPSPKGDAVLVVAGPALHVFEASTSRTHRIGTAASQGRWSRDGEAILYVQGREKKALVRAPLAGEPETLAEKVASFTELASGAIVIEGDPRGRLELWDPRSGRVDRLGDDVREWRTTAEATTVVLLDGPGSGPAQLVLWDIAAGAGQSFGPAQGLPAVGPDGRTLAFRTEDGTPVVWDAPRRRLLPLGAQMLAAPRFSPDGSHLLFEGGAGPRLLSIVAGAERPLDGVRQASWASEGATLLTIERTDVGETVWLLDLLAGEERLVAEVLRADAVEHANGGAVLLRVDLADRLLRWDREHGLEVLADPAQGLVFPFELDQQLLPYVAGGELRLHRFAERRTEVLRAGVATGAFTWLSIDRAFVMLGEPDPRGLFHLTLFPLEGGAPADLGDGHDFFGTRHLGGHVAALRRARSFDLREAELVHLAAGATEPTVLGTGTVDMMLQGDDDGLRWIRNTAAPTGEARLVLSDVRERADVPLADNASQPFVARTFTAWIGPGSFGSAFFVASWPDDPPEEPPAAPPPTGEGPPPPLPLPEAP